MRRVVLSMMAGLGALTLGGPLLVPLPPLEDTVPPRELADEGSRWLTVDGIDIHYRVAGEGPLGFVLLHPFFGSTWSWRELMEPLARYGTVVAFDRPGFGLSGRPLPGSWDGPNPYTRAANVRYAQALVEELGIERVVPVGSSAGGPVAFEFALAVPDRTVALILLAPAVNGDIGPPRWTRPLLRSPQGRRLGPLYLRRIGERGIEYLRTAYHDPSRVDEADLAGYRLPIRARDWDRGLFEVMISEPPPHLGPELVSIEVPALVLTGAHDRTISTEAGRQTAEALGDGRFVELADCGHLSFEECPQRVLAEIRPFLEEHVLRDG